MATKQGTLQSLAQMSRELAKPDFEYVILGEGNTAAREDASSFWVKASGYSMVNIREDGFVRVLFEPLLDALSRGMPDEEISQVLQQAKFDPQAPRPSVETFLHAICLSEGNATYVGHTHPVAVNTVLCSNKAEEAVSGRLFPDEIVSCGPASLFIPYYDPGLELARQFRLAMSRFADAHGELAKVVLIQNHGLIVLGKSPTDIISTTAMTVKAFRVLWGTYSLGGPHFLTPEQTSRISGRPDEHYRRTIISG